MLRGKIHRATITQCDPDYVGSITIDADLLRASGIRPNEAVLVLDIDNAVRFETYVIKGEPGSGVIGVNGAAAKLVEAGHKIIIVCFGLMQEDALDAHKAKVIICDEHNRVAESLEYGSTLDETLAAIN
ncbi:aspartate 1-decarboxylase [Phycisphaerales bacterium AB-hyl4]|uniref:Aspartate 1-decarboxylase n=1 Tax=Natronomicrosphaera hydrolytica TaxID=3242702 RepID=A0ABV4U9L3_9BACT